ncbi:MAG: FAD-dependent oxidoreductase [Clostridia bacterium]|nr:FAD-dependent oxidoreductase [Clostridia bacterium]
MGMVDSVSRRVKTDVVVIGGGTAGVFAAITAAANGVSTVLVDKNHILGGTMTAADVAFPGLFFAWGKQIIDGPCWEAIRRAEVLGGAVIPTPVYDTPRHWEQQITLNRFVFAAVLQEMCDEKGVVRCAPAMLSAVEESAAGVTALVTDLEGLLAIDAAVLIDATGDATAVGLAGYARERSETPQPATLKNRLSGYDPAAVSSEAVAAAFAKAALPPHITLHDLTHWLSQREIAAHIACPAAGTAAGRAQLERDAMHTVLELYRFYRTVKGLENIEIHLTATETGVRESYRIVGESTVTAADYISGKGYPDSVCYAFYPIDRHVMSGIEQQFFAPETVGQIPFGALIPKGAHRLLAAGRCVSSDTYANSALRVQAPCMAMGQAAGCAAALAVKNNVTVRQVPFAKLTAALKNIGAIVPEN